MSTWTQIYDPLNNIWLSALIAALPIFCFIICLMGFKMKSYMAGLYSRQKTHSNEFKCAV
ncbi:hypothetical protein ACT4UL_05720 [Bacillus sp. HC-TM]